ncbi:MAG: histidinol dehydrogenase, partial [Fimbriimonas sp.]
MPLLPIFPYVDGALLDRLALRGSEPDPEIAGVVAGIIEDVRARGDDALLDQARRFDAPGLTSLTPSENEWSVGVSAEFVEACARAATRIGAFHDQQLSNLRAGGALGWRAAGVGQRMIPVRRVGVYVPGGRANYPSSVLMNAIPARNAGVSEIVITTPAGTDGTLSAPVLHACRLVGASQVVKVGGAGAIAALALGTETV